MATLSENMIKGTGLTTDGSPLQLLTAPTNGDSVSAVRARVIAYELATQTSKVWIFEASVKEPGLFSPVLLQGTTDILGETGSTNWGAAIAVVGPALGGNSGKSNSVGSINIIVVGEVGKTIDWAAQLDQLMMTH